ncbi:MAG: hypothetical protein WBM98_03730 [Maribacter sp.]|uniref:hypothetical protein n=1 Tax=Maribacter sp. TaxID=1897614 RepID=UPI003C7708D9
MKLLVGLCFVVLMIFGIDGNAQVLSTKEAKVIMVVDETNETVSHIELFGNFQQMKKAEVLEKYPNSHFYIGLLEGSYELNKNNVIPTHGSTVIMYTDRQYLSINTLFPSDKFTVGDELDIGSIKAKVVSKKKGELILKTQ